MVGLIDIAPAAHRVLVPTSQGDAPVDVRGLTFEDIRDLMVRYPKFIDMMDSGLNAKAVMMAGPDAAAAVMAMACGSGNNPDVEKIMLTLPLGIQIEILGAMVKLTMPRGVDPFVDMLKALGMDPAKLRAAASSVSASPPPSSTSVPPDTTSTEQ